MTLPLDRVARAEPLAELLALPRSRPQLQLLGRVALTEAVRRRAAELRQEYVAAGTRVDELALVQPESDWTCEPPCLRLRTLDFAGVNALRETAGSVPVLNAMGILVAPERRMLVLHRRAATTQLYPNALQGVGGSYAPPEGRDPQDGGDLSRTVQREVCEELGLRLSLEPARMLLLRERDLGSYLLVYAGCTVTSGLQDPDVDRSEGDIHMIDYDALEHALTNPQRAWAPSGRLSVLCWLALGAPGAGDGVRFGGLRPQELVGRLIAQ